ncbi:hypothetical protein BKA82DRAFT_4510785 [Pisolithus tinctorius]|nr:hypothetical protein BKA82DRAFT_4510785 [Pisolithus tinctorius]
MHLSQLPNILVYHDTLLGTMKLNACDPYAMHPSLPHNQGWMYNTLDIIHNPIPSNFLLLMHCPALTMQLHYRQTLSMIMRITISSVGEDNRERLHNPPILDNAQAGPAPIQFHQHVFDLQQNDFQAEEQRRFQLQQQQEQQRRLGEQQLEQQELVWQLEQQRRLEEQWQAHHRPQLFTQQQQERQRLQQLHLQEEEQQAQQQRELEQQQHLSQALVEFGRLSGEHYAEDQARHHQRVAKQNLGAHDLDFPDQPGIPNPPPPGSHGGDPNANPPPPPSPPGPPNPPI